MIGQTNVTGSKHEKLYKEDGPQYHPRRLRLKLAYIILFLFLAAA